jgi:hypothetical protein
MPLIFCDLNFIVTGHQGADAYKAHLRQLAANGTVTFVLSPMHWVEAAEDGDAARGAGKADFMDSLNARWLHERRAIQRKEVAAAFFRFLQVPSAPPQMVSTVSDVIADLAGGPAERSSRDFVAHLRGIGQNHPLERSLRQAFESNQVNSDRFRSGRLDPAFLKKMERLYVQQLLPRETPTGVVIDEGSKRGFLNSFQMTDLPAFALEWAATQDSWRQYRHMNRNNFMDQQHLMALPYVDYFLTDDARLRALIGRISVGLAFAIANLSTKAEFDLRYP